MFEFKILQSPDRTQLGTYEHAADELVIGNAEGEMVIDDIHLGPSQLKFFFQGPQAFAQNLFPEIEIKLNNIAMADDAPTPTKARDTFQMGKTMLTLLKLKPGPLEPPQLDEYSKPKTAEKLPEGSAERAIFQVLEHMAKGEATPASAGPPTMPPPLPKPPIPPKI